MKSGAYNTGESRRQCQRRERTAIVQCTEVICRKKAGCQMQTVRIGSRDCIIQCRRRRCTIPRRPSARFVRTLRAVMRTVTATRRTAGCRTRRANSSKNESCSNSASPSSALRFPAFQFTLFLKSVSLRMVSRLAMLGQRTVSSLQMEHIWSMNMQPVKRPKRMASITRNTVHRT